MPEPKSTILFLCPHGGAKSLIAASYFNRLVADAALPYVGIAAAADTPYEAVPPPVVELLKGEGFDVRQFKPRQVGSHDIHAAAIVISIGCDLSNTVLPAAAIVRWDDVPMVSVDVVASAAAIRGHVQALAADLRTSRR